MRFADLVYLGFGLLVLSGYGFVASRGIVLVEAHQRPVVAYGSRVRLGGSSSGSYSGSGQSSGSRSHPTYWSTGTHGGK